jgi:hypothetical protein
MPSYKYGNLIQNLCCIHPVHVWEALDEETKLTDIRALLLRGTVSLCQCMEASMDINMTGLKQHVEPVQGAVAHNMDHCNNSTIALDGVIHQVW